MTVDIFDAEGRYAGSLRGLDHGQLAVLAGAVLPGWRYEVKR